MMDENYDKALRRTREAKEKKNPILDLAGLSLTQVPPEAFELKHLKQLGLSSNRLTQLPENISQLSNLTFLGLGDNHLSGLPKGISKLKRLTGIELATNKFTRFPESLTGCTNLNIIYLYNNELNDIPESISKLIKLSTLYLYGNKLKSLPGSISQIKSLSKLYLQRNQLRSLPAGISNLTNLEILNVSYNKLTRLPGSMSKLSNLTQLNLSGNQFEVGAEIFQLPPSDQIQEILKWQEAKKAGTLRAINEAKVIFIGESNYGKTHLIELLRQGEINRDIRTTHGIERSHMQIPFKNEEIRLNIWDLGGQEFMRSTHQFFFSERTLYVLVTLARRERNELNHWLKLANQLGNQAPVLVVINKIDLDPHDLDRKSLERDYPNIVGFVRTCIHDCEDSKAKDSITRLREKISNTVCDQDLMPSVFEQRPPEWFTVKEELERLEAQGKDFITYRGI